MVATSDAPMTTGIITHESSTPSTVWFCCHPASSFCDVCDRPYLLLFIDSCCCTNIDLYWILVMCLHFRWFGYDVSRHARLAHNVTVCTYCISTK
jgi:hypothetical protein